MERFEILNKADDATLAMKAEKDGKIRLNENGWDRRDRRYAGRDIFAGLTAAIRSVVPGCRHPSATSGRRSARGVAMGVFIGIGAWFVKRRWNARPST